MTSQIHPSVENFAKALETSDFANVQGALDARMCCNGLECGCQGATVGEYLAHELRNIEGPRVGDGTGDAAIAIAEHAHGDGFDAGVAWAQGAGATEQWEAKFAAWSAYEPSEDIKALS